MEKLNRKQKKVMEELFEGKDEKEVLDNNNVSRAVFNRWTAEDAWANEFDRRVEAARRQSQIIITTYQPVAAAKLVQLTNCEKEQTARQACLDVIQMPRIAAEREGSDAEKESGMLSVSEETARELIEVLARDVNKKE